jgi:hypothetical protein
MAMVGFAVQPDELEVVVVVVVVEVVLVDLLVLVDSGSCGWVSSSLPPPSPSSSSLLLSRFGGSGVSGLGPGELLLILTRGLLTQVLLVKSSTE